MLNVDFLYNIAQNIPDSRLEILPERVYFIYMIVVYTKIFGFHN